MKKLGKTDLQVNNIGLGCMGLSHAYGNAKSKDEAINFLKQSFKMFLFFLTHPKFMLDKQLMGI